MCTCARLPKVISHHLPSQQYHYFQQYHDLILLFTVLPPFNVQTKQPINFPTIFEFIPLSLPPPPRILYFESYIYIYIYSPNTVHHHHFEIKIQKKKHEYLQSILSYVYFLPSPSPSFRIQNLTGDVNDDRDIIDVRMNECWRRIKDWKKRRKKKKSERTLTYWDRRAPDGRGVSACLSVGVALERLPSKFSPPPASRVTLFPSQSTPSLAEEAFGGGSVMAGRSRRFQDPGIGRCRASTPNQPSTIASATPSEGKGERGGRGGEGKRKRAPGITDDDAGRCCAVFPARQVDMCLTCANVGRCLEEGKKKGVKAWRTREREGPLPFPIF